MTERFITFPKLRKGSMSTHSEDKACLKGSVL